VERWESEKKKEMCEWPCTATQPLLMPRNSA